MSSLTGKSLNPVMNRRSVIASAAGLGAMSILAGCSSTGGDSGSASGDASFKIGTIGPLTGANASYGKSVTQAIELGCKEHTNALENLYEYDKQYNGYDHNTCLIAVISVTNGNITKPATADTTCHCRISKNGSDCDSCSGK